MGSRARGDEQLEIVLRRLAQTRVPRRGRSLEHIHRLAGTVLARSRQPLLRRLPEVCDGTLLPDHHPCVPGDGHVRERVATGSGRDDVRAGVAERLEPPVLLDRREPAQAAPRHVLEEDALDRVLRAECEDLLEPRLLQPGHRHTKL